MIAQLTAFDLNVQYFFKRVSILSEEGFWHFNHNMWYYIVM